MNRPLSAKEISDFLSKFAIEPVYVKSPYGEVFVLTKLSFVDIFDEEGNEEALCPMIFTEETDLVVEQDNGSIITALDDMIPPS